MTNLKFPYKGVIRFITVKYLERLRNLPLFSDLADHT